jgi:hypothetical protein
MRMLIICGSHRILCVWYVVLWGEERTNAYRVSVGNMKEICRLQDLVVDVRAILTLWRRHFLSNFSTPCI